LNPIYLFLKKKMQEKNADETPMKEKQSL